MILWHLLAQQVPSLISAQLIKYGGYFLSLEISRWWNLLLAISVVSAIIMFFDAAGEKLNDFDIGMAIGLLIGPGIGVIISIAVGLFIVLSADFTTGFIAGLVLAVIISIIAGLVVSLGAGCAAGLGFGFGIGLGVDFFVGLFISFGAGLVAGLITIVSSDLAVMVRLIVKYNLLAKIRKWLSVSN
ncbi:hypothetical protein COU01_00385 [Candidatus Falkowbacteria bacterium CG10_big_fil_rev_8_21_14_0_10_44_15]|uniref:Uncharacterized protein n=1 Tax=Candidatus Falkowbacteria bacterium CG10_big_fil_rev_8_21_14_0_10_44_15 TaxID=1974569 RepID=A0A2H0V0Y8_9BACT|nr:MAG: hypothetical protein COU01_00385 [Candidatus Falkowbacteria bacterium CG10_big_fil_rev_8_21_14_0_10_44_15]